MNHQNTIPGGSATKLVIQVEGPRVGTARLSAADFADIVRRTQQALKRVGQVLYGQESAGQGRKPKEIEQLCELFLVEWKGGSAVAGLELPVGPPQMHLFGCVGEESLKALLDGIQAVASGTVEPSHLPVGFDLGVLQTCEALGSVLPHGIDQLRLSANGRLSKTAVYDSGVRNKFRTLLELPATVNQVVTVGRLEELNGHGALTGRLWEPDGTRWTCRFRIEHRELLPEAWLHNVQAKGKKLTEEGKENILEVDSLLILDETTAAAAGEALSAASSFWAPQSLDNLIRQQGITPAGSLDEISALWPAEDDADELLDFIHSRRTEHRQLARETQGRQ